MKILCRNVMVSALAVSVMSCLLIAAAYLSDLPVTRTFYSGCEVVWRHKINSPVKLAAALASGAGGVEVDVMYDNREGKYIVTRQYPYEMHNGVLYYLDELFEAVSDSGLYVWIDLKDASAIDSAARAAEGLSRLLHENGLHDRVIVESMEALPLWHFRQKEIYTSYWTSFHRQQVGELRYLVKDVLRKLIIRIARFDVMSMPYYHYDDNLKNKYSALFFHIFTVNEHDDILEYRKDHSVKVILTDIEQLDGLNHQFCSSGGNKSS